MRSPEALVSPQSRNASVHDLVASLNNVGMAKFSVICILSIAVVLRLGMGLGSYSGQHNEHGDYEAQRHWMEVTLNLPLSEWYVNTTRNDLSYWGLDYPPLSAYHAFLMGFLSSVFEPGSVDHMTSRGFYTETHKFFMRGTVLISDCLVFFSAALRFFLLSAPPLIVIDHGHFQYNCVALGLVLWAVCFIHEDRLGSASVAFTLSLWFKQTCLYFAPAFFFMILGKIFQTTQSRRSHFMLVLRKVLRIGVIVIGTSAAIVAPFFIVNRAAGVEHPETEYFVKARCLSPIAPMLRRISLYDVVSLRTTWRICG